MVLPAAGGARRTAAVSDNLRLFIALPLPEAVRQRIVRFQREWQGDLRGNFIRWTPAEQIHLTLRFLGDIPVAAVSEIETAFRRACGGVTGFDLNAAGSGCFPDVRKPRVLWVGVGGDADALARLQWRIADETRAWGEPEAREFRAHLTIGRVKDAPGVVAREIAQRVQTFACGEVGRWRVRDVLLMRSELTPAGAKHSQLAKVGLVC